VKKEIYDELVLLSGAFDKPQTPQRLTIYTEDLSEYDSKSVIMAIREIRKRCKFFPALSEIIDLVKNPGLPTDEQAILIANEIIECLSRFGANNVKELQAFLGPEKYGVIERAGGWTNLCMVTYQELPSTRAQLRELAKAYLNRSKLESSGGPLVINTEPIKTQLQKVNFGGLLSETCN